MKSDFTLKGYENMLSEGLKNNYAFHSFNEITHDHAKKVCYLRHDIDADVQAAYELAMIEKDLGIRSTYFFMMRSPVYNIFSRANHRLVEKIISAGHHLGIHFDENFAANYPADLQKLIDNERKIFETNFGMNTNVVSFHQPSPRILNEEVQLDGLINTYCKSLFRDIHYISDSNKIWKNEHPFDVFRNSIYEKVQLLIHPMWWVFNKNYTTRAIWKKILIRSFHQKQAQLTETERAYGDSFNLSLAEPRTKNHGISK
jgi:hypothetical protein